MTKRAIRDVAASVRARLQATALETGRPFQEVLQYFAMERFGDIVIPEIVLLDYPTILDHPAPKLNGYSRETPSPRNSRRWSNWGRSTVALATSSISGYASAVRFRWRGACSSYPRDLSFKLSS